MKPRSALVALALGCGALFPVAGASEVACASGGRPRAALVVDAGDQGGVRTYCVALDADQVSGIRLIELAHRQHGLSYYLGYAGSGVCMLAGVGYREEECFKAGRSYWAYWHGNGSGGWSYATAGAADSSVGDGDVEGWSWGDGAPPQASSSLNTVCASAQTGPRRSNDEATSQNPADRPSSSKSARGATSQRGPVLETNTAESASPQPVLDSAADSSGGSGNRTDAPGAAPRTPRGSQSQGRARAAVMPTRAAAADRGAGDRGPPVAGVVGLVIALALGGAGALRARRRRPTASG